MCVGMSMDMCIDMCVDVCTDMCTGMGIDMCVACSTCSTVVLMTLRSSQQKVVDMCIDM